MAEPPPRISSLDALRGVAVLGILVVNIQSYAFVASARTNPTVQGDLHGGNWWVWLLTYVLFDGKFIALFAILFGASIVLLANRSERRGIPAGPVHFRRLAILLVIGLLHAYLLWYGDWLTTLAVTGGLAFLYRDLSAPRLLAAGIVVYAIGSITVPLIALWASASAPEMVAQVAAEWRPSPEAVAWELARYRGGWLTQMEHRIPAAFRYETSYLAIRGLWQMTGLMLVGMALQKLDVLTARRPRAVYAAMLVAGLGIGIPAVLYGVSWSVTSGWSVETFRAITDPLNYWGGLIACAGWIGAVMLLARSGISLRGLEAVGRLALTNYLLQSVICTTIFYGHGLGLFGRVERVGQAGIVLAVWAVQIAGSVRWLRSFDFGPVEWAWRCLTYGRWMPLRRAAPAAGPS
jgi:uncharacterized protein